VQAEEHRGFIYWWQMCDTGCCVANADPREEADSEIKRYSNSLTAKSRITPKRDEGALWRGGLRSLPACDAGCRRRASPIPMRPLPPSSRTAGSGGGQRRCPPKPRRRCRGALQRGKRRVRRPRCRVEHLQNMMQSLVDKERQLSETSHTSSPPAFVLLSR